MTVTMYNRVRDIQEYVLSIASSIAQKVRDGVEVVNLLDAMTRVEFYAKEALDAMNHPRNCDVGTTQEQVTRYIEYTNKHCPSNGGKCEMDVDCVGGCELAWAQMSFEGGEARVMCKLDPDRHCVDCELCPDAE